MRTLELEPVSGDYWRAPKENKEGETELVQAGLRLVRVRDGKYVPYREAVVLDAVRGPEKLSDLPICLETGDGPEVKLVINPVIRFLTDNQIGMAIGFMMQRARELLERYRRLSPWANLKYELNTGFGAAEDLLTAKILQIIANYTGSEAKSWAGVGMKVGGDDGEMLG